jgi:hypothetical protein
LKHCHLLLQAEQQWALLSVSLLQREALSVYSRALPEACLRIRPLAFQREGLRKLLEMQPREPFRPERRRFLRQLWWVVLWVAQRQLVVLVSLVWEWGEAHSLVLLALEKPPLQD